MNTLSPISTLRMFSPSKSDFIISTKRYKLKGSYPSTIKLKLPVEIEGIVSVSVGVRLPINWLNFFFDE